MTRSARYLGVERLCGAKAIYGYGSSSRVKASGRANYRLGPRVAESLRILIGCTAKPPTQWREGGGPSTPPTSVTPWDVVDGVNVPAHGRNDHESVR